MNDALYNAIKALLDGYEQQSEIKKRLENLEQWQKEVEKVWSQIIGEDSESD